MKLVILGVPVELHPNPTQWCSDRLQEIPRRGGQIVTLNTEMVMLARQNPDLADLLHNTDLIIPDGAGVVLYAQLAGKKIIRVPGIELAEHLLKQAAITHLRVFFLGAAPGVAAQAARMWQEQVPTLSIAGVAHGYFTPEEEVQLCREIQSSQPDILLIGLGVPRQEFWIQKHRHLFPKTICIGVGGSFDVWSGRKSRAPRWMGQLHLEWLYRLYQEPWRWRRMLVLPQFVWCTLRERLCPTL